MQKIDFLPKRYREQAARKRTKVWQLIVISMFGAIIAATAVAQHMFRRSIEGDFEEIESEYAMAQLNNTNFENSKQDLAGERAKAGLYAYLEHPWPRSQILSAVTLPLPDAVTLTELSILGEVEQRSEVRSRARNPRRSEETGATDRHLMPAQRDFKKLQEKYGESKTVVHLSGYVIGKATIHSYVGRLRVSKLIADAELVSQQASGDSAKRDVFEFVVRIVVTSMSEYEVSPASDNKLPKLREVACDEEIGAQTTQPDHHDSAGRGDSGLRRFHLPTKAERNQ